jgi:sterol desaturase/sphingolipid hydroxylase (fatty acid hydroxylase superfamily)
LIALKGSAIHVGNWSAWQFGWFILGYTLAADLSVYLIHRLHHRSKILWPLHALHHSAEVMTPVTLFRKHPIWNLSASCMQMLFTGTFQGAFIFLFYGVPSVELLFGINTVYVFYNFFGANLRHSHVWMSWGKPLSYLFISPAMHQIHHDPTRMNRNYGETFAIWDWMFGSLYIPKHRERFAIGLGEANPHTTLTRAYYLPVVEALRQVAIQCRSIGRGLFRRQKERTPDIRGS